MAASVLTDNAITILKHRYLQPGETPEEMWWRVASHVATGEKGKEHQVYWAQQFNRAMCDLEFLPNSPTLMNAGTGKGSLSACFVLIPDDDMESIMQVQHDMVMIHKWGGGTGFGFSRLRPKGAPIFTTQGKAMGPVAVLEGYSTWGQIVTQGGKRNGANMGMLHVDHPDIRKFIHMKDDGVTAQNFNISALASDDFMEVAAAREGSSRDLLQEIVRGAWSTGDPGLGFIDQVNRTRPPGLEEIEASNPCGEEYLENYGNCCLGSIDISKFVAGGVIDWPRLSWAIKVAVRFLNDVIEVNQFPVSRLRETNLRSRRIGLGVMGWHDALLKMRIPYSSEDAVHAAGAFMEEFTAVAWRAAGDLAEARGKPLNASVTTIAPTGTISAIAGCSSGIEPLFAWRMVKNVLDGQRLVEEHPLYAELQEDFRRVPSLGRTAREISWEQHVLMQAAFQAHTTNSVSKTINMPNSATVQDVWDAYLLAWASGCKGITIYRDGSRKMQVLEDVR